MVVPLAAVTRGPRVESAHFGAYAVADAAGAIVLSGGDIDAPAYPRSAVKAMQALPLLLSGAADRYGLTDEELALACASHAGEPRHAALAASMLEKSDCDAAALECGVHWPFNLDAGRALAAAGEEPSALHNNCSGKHAGFVCTARMHGLAPAGYVHEDHPVMADVLAAVAAILGVTPDPSRRGIDGCSIPTEAVPLRALATGFARFGTGTRLPTDIAAAAARLRAAVAAHPHAIAGTGRFDTIITEAMGTAVFLKGGAEGVHCAALPELGLGLAIKAADGASRAAEVATAALLAHLLPDTTKGYETVTSCADRALTNWNGIEVGRLQGLPGF